MIGTYPRKAKYTMITENLLTLDKGWISPSYTRDYPFVIETGRGREVVDVEGNMYLDFGAGIAVTSTGHCHPAIVRAIIKQSEKLIHMSGTDFYYENQILLAQKIAELIPEVEDAMIFYGNSGAEAIEAAMKLARYYTKRPAYIAFTGAFHGRTMGALSLTGSKVIQKDGFLPLQPVTHVPYADCRNCSFGSSSGKCESSSFKCIDYAKNLLTRTIPPESVAAIFVEAIQGEGGYVVPPDGWLDFIEQLALDIGALFVVDEVQSGIGRTGKWFAYQHTDVHPDIVTMAKGIASGMPLGVMAAKEEIMKSWPPGAHASTFGGNPISCAAALETLKIIESGDMMGNAERMGKYLHDKLWDLRQKFRIEGRVRNPRGRGLMRAIDIDTAEHRNTILHKCFEDGLILLGCGKTGIRFCPALNVTKEEIDACVLVLEKAITAVT